LGGLILIASGLSQDGVEVAGLLVANEVFQGNDVGRCGSWRTAREINWKVRRERTRAR
jgi:hypothetical protein